MTLNTNFSILMSLYDKENHIFLNECLLSLYNQTIKSNEIILVLDGPINSMLVGVLKHWEKLLPLRTIQLENNMGLGSALNIGLNSCSNEIVLRMDTDDICVPNRCQIQIEFLLKNPEIDVLGTNIIEFSENVTHTISYRCVPETNSEILRYIKWKSPMNHMTVAYKKSKIIEIGSYQHHPNMEDYNLWIRCVSNNLKIHNLQQVLVYARVGNGMLARRRGIGYFKSEFKLFNLKIRNGINGYIIGLPILLIRSVVRLFPVSILKWIYSCNRKANLK